MISSSGGYKGKLATGKDSPDNMQKFHWIVGSIIGSIIVWYLGSLVGITTGNILSTAGTIAGVLAGIKSHRAYFV